MLGSRIRLSSGLSFQRIFGCLRRRRGRNSRHHDKRQRLEIESVLVPPCPRAELEKVCPQKYLHGDNSIIDDGFLGEEVSADGCLVLSAELLVDLILVRLFRHRATYWFIKDVLPTLGVSR